MIQLHYRLNVLVANSRITEAAELRPVCVHLGYHAQPCRSALLDPLHTRVLYGASGVQSAGWMEHR